MESIYESIRFIFYVIPPIFTYYISDFCNLWACFVHIMTGKSFFYWVVCVHFIFIIYMPDDHLTNILLNMYSLPV